MTDKEIIEACVGCCISHRLECEDCIYGNRLDCLSDLYADIIALVDRQQAEIEKARAEAIKEFAERLGNYKEYRYNENCDFVPYVRLSDIEKVVYEMVGAEDD